MSTLNINLFDFARRIHRPLILDGAMGSLLQQRGVKEDDWLWTSIAGIEHGEAVQSIHKEYIEAGADIITTNTFRSNPAAVKNSSRTGITSDYLVKTNVELAKSARGGLPVIIAGSNAPAEDCYQVNRTLQLRDLEENHEQHIDSLMLNGCDFVLNETQSHFDEISIICNYCSKNDIPFIVSIFFTGDLKLLSGENIEDVIRFLQDYNPLAIGFNCIRPDVFVNFIKNHNPDYSWGTYLNCGSGNYTDKIITCGISGQEYARIVSGLLQFNPCFVGACCGSNNNHIEKIRETVNGLSRD
ncbi:MAG: homocysteine S-methyltransferase family protein [Ignavibacteriales bacterium]